MKKFLCLVVFCVLILHCGTAQAKDVDRRIIKNATVEQVQPIILDTINLYDGIITVKDINKEENKYVVDYNGTTLLGLIGWSKSTKYPKAIFSCQLKQKGNDVEISNRKVKYSGWFNSQTVFNHYKKLYQELKYNGFTVEKI